MQNKNTLVIGVLMILFGIIFLLANIGTVDLANLWPSIPLFIGIVFVVGFLNSRKDTGLLMPGSILIIIGLLFFYCNFAGWEHMRTIWPIFIIAPSVGFFAMYILGEHDRGLLVPASILLVIGLIFLGINTYLGIFWPIILILFGLILIGINLIKRPASETSEEMASPEDNSLPPQNPEENSTPK